MNKLLKALLIISFLVLWEAIASNNPTLKYFVSTPMTSFYYASTHFTNILESTIVTAIESISGFCLAIIFSFTVMFICLLKPNILKIILPLFVISQILPMITLAPLFIILFGMGLISKIAMVVLMCFFPIFINFATGVNSVTQNIKDLLYIYNAGKIFTICKITIPLSTPYIFAGLKISTTMAIMGAIVAEFLGARDGLGKNLYLAPKYSQPELMICSIVLTAFLGWILYKFVETIERRLVKWN